MAMISVSVCGVDGAQTQFEMEVEATVEDLKACIEQQWHIPVLCQSLLLDDVGLQNFEHLSEYSTVGNVLLVAVVVDHRALYKRLGHKGRERSVAFEMLHRWAKHDGLRTVALASSCLEDADFLVRRGGIRALAEVAAVGDELAISDLMARLEDTNQWVRAAAIESLSKIAHQGDDQVTASMCTALNDADEWVKREAAEALGKVASRSNIKAVVSLLEAIRCNKSDFLIQSMVCTYERLVGERFLPDDWNQGHEKRAETLLAMYDSSSF